MKGGSYLTDLIKEFLGESERKQTTLGGLGC